MNRLRPIRVERAPGRSVAAFLLATMLVFPAACRRRPLADRLVTDDAGVRNRAMAELKDLSPEDQRRLVPALIPRLQDPDGRIANFAGDAIVAIGGSAESAILPLIDNPDVFVRTSALNLLHRLPTLSPDAGSSIVGALSDGHPLAREEAALALAAHPDLLPPAEPALRTLLKDPSESVRSAAAQALGVLHPESVAAHQAKGASGAKRSPGKGSGRAGARTKS